MKKFWKKTIDTLTVGYESAMDKTGAKKLQEDPAFLERLEKLKFYENTVKDTRRSLNSFSAALSNIGNVQSEVSSFHLKDVENLQNPENELNLYKQTLIQYSNISESCRTITNKASEDLIQPNTGELDEIIKEINRLKTFLEKRKKHHILMQNNSLKFEKLKEKQQPITPEFLNEKQKHESKYGIYNESFISGVDLLGQRMKTIYGKLLDNTETVLIQTITQLKENTPKDFSNPSPEFTFPAL